MSVPVLKDCKIYLGQYDISGDMNMVSLTEGVDTLEDTAFGATLHTKKAGLRSLKAHGEGYVQYGTGQTTVDGRLQQKFGTVNVPLSVCPLIGGSSTAGNAGERGYFSQVLHASYNQGAKIGELLKFQIDAEASGVGTQLVQGTIFEDGKTSRTTAGNSGVITLGAVSATQNLYAILHVLAFSGTNVTFKVRSAVTSFATITDRITFTAVTDLTNPQYATPVSGAITDTFWRVDWTGTFTSFSAVVIVGIQ